MINRGIQYGKTTTLMALEEYLKNDYMVLFMDFQMMSSTNFADEQTFTVKFAEYIEKLFSKREQKDGIDLRALEELASLKEKQNISMDMLFARLSRSCETCEKPIVLMIDEAVKILMDRQIPLFGSMMRHISEYPDLKKLLYAMLFWGEQAAYNPDNETIELAHMFGYVKNSAMGVQVANRIFEMRLYNLFLSEEELSSAMSRAAKQDRNQFVAGGRLDMYRVLEKFVEHFHDIYGENDEKFLEDSGRRLFLLYLKPIINGVGNYYIEHRQEMPGGRM